MKVRWRTSTFTGHGGSCVEVAFLPDGAIACGTRRTAPARPHRFSASHWSAFLTDVRTGRFAHR